MKRRKVRAFVIGPQDQPVAGAGVELLLADRSANGDREDVVLGRLSSDLAGYVSFDLERFPAVADDSELILRVGGDEPSETSFSLAKRAKSSDARPASKSSRPTDGATATLCVPRYLKTNLRSRPDRVALARPSIERPDPCDYELAPSSLVVSTPKIVGDDGCVHALPATGPIASYAFSRLVALWPPSEDEVPGEITPIDTRETVTPDGPLPLRWGKLLDYEQVWESLGHALGEIVYSLPLAPGESTQLAVIEWAREDAINRTDTVAAREQLDHEMRRDRTITDIVRAGLREEQGGASGMAGLAAAAIIPSKVPVAVGAAIGHAWSNSYGSRDLAAVELQRAHDQVVQASSSMRTLNSTVIVQASQAESNRLKTRTVANHNHCHALTIQYYEVLRHLRVVTRLVRRRNLVFVPFAPITFVDTDLIHFESVLRPALLERSLASGFAAANRLSLSPSPYDRPDPVVDEDSDVEDEETPPPDTRTFPVQTFDLTLRTTSHNFSTTWGEVVVEVFDADTGSFVEVWRKARVGERGPELNKLAFPVSAAGAELDARKIGSVRVGWREDNGADSWDFQGITLKANVAGISRPHAFVDLNGTSAPSNSKSRLPAITYFDDSPSRIYSPQISVLAFVPPPLDGDDTDSGDQEPQTGDALKRADEVARARLLQHLNGRRDYYNRVIALAMDGDTRWVLVERAVGHVVARSLEPEPVGAIGYYVAFVFNDDLPGAIEYSEEDPAPEESIATLPTRGLFAEAQLGSCNSCERRDVTRMWDWTEATVEPQPDLSDLRPGPRGQTPTVTPASPPSNVLQVVTPPALPDPTALAGALTLLGTPGIFRDMSGLRELSGLLGKLVDGTFGALTDGEKAKAQQAKRSVDSALEASSSSSNSAMPPRSSAAEAYDDLTVAKEIVGSADALGLSRDEAAEVATTRLLSGGGPGGVLGMLKDLVTGAAPGGGQTVQATATDPSMRECCALGQWDLGVPGVPGALDPSALAGHRYAGGFLGGGLIGYVYTAAAGLVDLGHVRDMADMTKFVYDALSAGATRLRLFEGDVTVKAHASTGADRRELAGAIAYVESWAHELTTWDDESSFSPEDIPSNIIGIETAKRAIASGGAFDTAVDSALAAVLADLKVRSKSDTNAVLAKIKNDWYRLAARVPIPLELLRRNFDGTTWPAGMPFDSPTTFPWLSPLVFAPHYPRFDFAIRRTVAGKSGVTLATMAAETAALRAAFVAANPGKDKP